VSGSRGQQELQPLPLALLVRIFAAAWADECEIIRADNATTEVSKNEQSLERIEILP
jgi:hypothetical protein